jgi:hypothetical protein
VLQRFATDQALAQGGCVLLGETLVVDLQRSYLGGSGSQQIAGARTACEALVAMVARTVETSSGRHQVRRYRLQLLEPLGDGIQLVTQVGVLGPDPPAPPVTRTPAEPVQTGGCAMDLALLVIDAGGWEPEHLGDERQQSLGVLAIQWIGDIALGGGR